MIPRGLTRRGPRVAQVEGGYTRAGLLGTLVVLVVAATCIRLGLWQLDRLEQRRARNAVAEARMAHAPVDVDRISSDTAESAYRRITLTGSCEGEAIVLAARSRHGSPGVHLLCRFRSAAGRVLLLDRGWLPSADARTVERGWLVRQPRDTTFDALVIPFPEGRAARRTRESVPALAQGDSGVALAEPEPRVIYRLNRAEAAAATGLPLDAWFAQAIGPDDVMPIPDDLPDLGEGPHLGYAVQWFSFAAIALIGWIVLVARRRPALPGTNRSG